MVITARAPTLLVIVEWSWRHVNEEETKAPTKNGEKCSGEIWKGEKKSSKARLYAVQKNKVFTSHSKDEYTPFLLQYRYSDPVYSMTQRNCAIRLSGMTLNYLLLDKDRQTRTVRSDIEIITVLQHDHVMYVQSNIKLRALQWLNVTASSTSRIT